MPDFKEIDKEIERRKVSEKLGGNFLSDISVVPDWEILEQASGAPAAEFVASLIPKGVEIADLTAGLGVDSFYFSRRASRVISIERNQKRAEALSENLKLAGVKNVEVVEADCIEWLTNVSVLPPYIYADPARRDMTGRRFLLTEEYSPDISSILPLIKDKVEVFIVKVSPLLDLTSLVRKFPEITGFKIVEVKREVKELLLIFDFTSCGIKNEKEIGIECIGIDKGGAKLIYECSLNDDSSEPLKLITGKSEVRDGFIYEPAPSIMKSGIFGPLVRKFPSLRKLSSNTNLFYSEERFTDFPGRRFKILEQIGSSGLKRLTGSRLNVISRNHPASASELEKRYRLKASERDFVIACTAGKDKIILKAEKLEF